MATHSSIRAWEITWTEEPGGLEFMGSQRFGHLEATQYAHIKERTNKNLLDGIGNSTQYSLMTYMGNKSKKKLDICMCITDSLCCTVEIKITL